MLRRSLQTHFGVRLFLLFALVFSLSTIGISAQNNCSQYTKPSAGASTGEMVKLDTLIEHKEQYYGKTITVEGEMHRIFTDHVFTIEDDDFLKDDDVLIISDVSRSQAVTPVKKSIE